MSTIVTLTIPIGSANPPNVSPDHTPTAEHIPDALRIGTWNCQSLKGAKLSYAIEYCKRSGNDIIALQETKHHFCELYSKEYEMRLIERKKPVKEYQFLLDAKSWKGLEGFTIKIPLHSCADVNITDDDDVDENEENDDEENSADKKTVLTDIDKEKGRKKLNTNYGMAFFIKKSSCLEVIDVKPLHSRIAFMKLKFNGVEMCLLNVYAPAAGTKTEWISRNFFQILSEKYTELRREFTGSIIICGDLNAFPQNASAGLYEPWILRHVYGSFNKHGIVFYDFLLSNALYYLNSRFERKPEQKWTFFRIRKGEKRVKELDGFLCDRTDIVEVVDTFPKMDESIDHRMVSSIWRISTERENNRIKKRLQQEALKKWKAITGDASYIDILSLVEGNTYCATTEHLYGFPLDILKNNAALQIRDLQEIKKIVAQHFKKDCAYSIYLRNNESSTVNSNFQNNIPPIEEEEVLREIESFKFLDQSVTDEAFARARKIGGEKLVTALTKIFNDALTMKIIPDDWKKVILKFPMQTTHLKTIKECDFTGTISPFGRLYSNILARRLNERLGKFIHEGQWYYDKTSSDIETQREEKKIENIFTLAMLIEKFRGNSTPIYFLFVKYSKAIDNVPASIILESLKLAKSPGYLITALSELLTNVKAVVRIGDEPVECEKNNGVHLGNIASRLLLTSVLKVIFDKCDKQNGELGIKFDIGYLKRIQFDDEVVLIDRHVDKIKTHFELLVKISKEYGLCIDETNIILIKNSAQTGAVSFQFGNKTIETAKTAPSRLVCYLDRVITIKDEMETEIRRRSNKAREALNAVTLSNCLKTRDEKISFLEKKLIPVLFYACETWQPKNDDFKTLGNFINDLKKHLSIDDFSFNLKSYIFYKKACFINLFSNRDHSFCSKMLKGWTPTGVKSEGTDWSRELVTMFNKQYQPTLSNDKQKQIGKMNGSKLLDFAKDNSAKWNHFMEYCKKQAYPNAERK